MHAGKLKVFVLMPFSEEFQSIFDHLIKPALSECEVDRADTRLDQRNILAKIVRGIADADLVIADVTTTNANVMYELGVAHTLGRPTIMISQDTANLPFDIRSYPVQPYSTHFRHAADLVDRLKNLAKAHIEGVIEFGSPVGDYLDHPPSAPSPRPQSQLPTTYGFIDFGFDMEVFNEQIESVFTDLASHSALLERVFKELTPEVRKTGISDFPGSARQQMELAMRTAEAIKQFAAGTNREFPKLHDLFERYQRAALWLVSPERLREMTPEQHKTMRQSFESFAGQVSLTLGTSAEFKASLSDMKSISNDIAIAVEAAEHALDGTIGELLFAKSVLARLLDLMGDRPPI